jgi:hypothetical protein
MDTLVQQSVSAATAANQKKTMVQKGLAVADGVAGCAAILQAWSYAVLVAAAFACGVLLQRFNSQMVGAAMAAGRERKHVSM